MNRKKYFSPEVSISIIKNINMICVSAGFGDDEETGEMHAKYHRFDNSDTQGTDNMTDDYGF